MLAQEHYVTITLNVRVVMHGQPELLFAKDTSNDLLLTKMNTDKM